MKKIIFFLAVTILTACSNHPNTVGSDQKIEDQMEALETSIYEACQEADSLRKLAAKSLINGDSTPLKHMQALRDKAFKSSSDLLKIGKEYWGEDSMKMIPLLRAYKEALGSAGMSTEKVEREITRIRSLNDK